MAEVVGLVASIAAIIQITGQITVPGFQYPENVKSVPRDLENLVVQLSSFNKVLTGLKACCDSNKLPPQTLRKVNQQIDECIQDLENELKRIHSILEALRDRKLGGKRQKFGAVQKA